LNRVTVDLEQVRSVLQLVLLALDLPRGRMFYTSLGGEVGTASLDGANPRLLLTKQKALTGIAVVDLQD